MKKHLLLFSLLLSSLVFSQAPQGINYQAVIRNNVGAVVTNTAVSIRMNVIQGSNTGFISLLYLRNGVAFKSIFC